MNRHRARIFLSAAALLLSGTAGLMAGCESGPSIPDDRPRANDLIARGLNLQTMPEWEQTLGELSLRENESPASRLALGELFLALYRDREFVREHWREMPTLAPFVQNRTDPAGSGLLAEAAWMYASVVAENVSPADRAQGVQKLIEIFGEKSDTITASVTSNLPEKAREELTDVQRRLVWLGLNYIQIALLTERYGSFGRAEDLAALRRGLEHRGELYKSFQKECPADGAFAQSFERWSKDLNRIAALSEGELMDELEQWRLREFVTKSVERHQREADAAKSMAIDVKVSGAGPVQVFEHVERALLNYLYVVETSCPVHVAPPHAGALPPESLQDARSTLLWALSNAQSAITRPESP